MHHDHLEQIANDAHDASAKANMTAMTVASYPFPADLLNNHAAEAWIASIKDFTAKHAEAGQQYAMHCAR